ncbi:hypothetical protein CU048_06030 [Beijerinckiaceae bacterium]|nr:hypothetical protein CU048_06030 [Beijerinckiaceae bacterium]
MRPRCESQFDVDGLVSIKNCGCMPAPLIKIDPLQLDGSGPPRDVGIVTVSAIPNLTGTSVNPLIRAASLVEAGWPTTLYLPWFALEEQEREYGRSFADPDAQVREIEAWLPDALRPHRPNIVFYPVRFNATWALPLPAMPIASVLRRHRTLILEELERHFFDGRWLDLSAFGFKHRFPLVISLLHTNFPAFVGLRTGRWIRPLSRAMTRVLSRRICDHSFSVVSAAPFLRELGEPMVSLNGVGANFFAAPESSGPTQGAYFIGKLIPEKGLHNAFRLLKTAGVSQIDLFGNGDLSYVRAQESAYRVAAVLRGGTATPWRCLAPYRVFINCSTSEVLCTTTAEALAMRKWVILPRHTSNRFFEQFDNCLVFETDTEFAACWHKAMAEEPRDDPQVAERLSWAAATRRLTGLLSAPPAMPYHDPPPYYAIPAREGRDIRFWLRQSARGMRGSFTGSHVGQ